MKKTLALLLLSALVLINYFQNATPDQNPYLITDYSRLHPIKVTRVIEGISGPPSPPGSRLSSAAISSTG